MLAVILVGIGPVAARDGFDQVALVVGVGFLLQPGGGDADQIAVFSKKRSSL